MPRGPGRVVGMPLMELSDEQESKTSPQDRNPPNWRTTGLSDAGGQGVFDVGLHGLSLGGRQGVQACLGWRHAGLQVDGAVATVRRQRDGFGLNGNLPEVVGVHGEFTRGTTSLG